MIEILDNFQYVSNINTSPFVFPDELYQENEGVDFAKLPVSIEIEINPEKYIDTFKIEFMDKTTNIKNFNVEIDSMNVISNISSLSYLHSQKNSSNLKQIKNIKIIIVNTNDNNNPKNVKLSLKTCSNNERIKVTTPLILTKPSKKTARECSFTEILDNSELVTDIITKPYVYPAELFSESNGVNFEIMPVEILIKLNDLIKFDHLKLEFVDESTNINKYEIILNEDLAIRNLTNSKFNLDNDVLEKLKPLKLIKVNLLGTRDNKNPMNVKLSLKACLEKKTSPMIYDRTTKKTKLNATTSYPATIIYVGQTLMKKTTTEAKTSPLTVSEADEQVTLTTISTTLESRTKNTTIEHCNTVFCLKNNKTFCVEDNMICDGKMDCDHFEDENFDIFPTEKCNKKI
jgi:hypothetical protein